MTFLALPRAGARAPRAGAAAWRSRSAAVLALFVALDGGLRGPHRRRRSARTARTAPTASCRRPRCTRRRSRSRTHALASRARARLHLHGQLLRPQRTADHRAERPADPRPQPAAGVVPAGARTGRRRQPQPAELHGKPALPGGRARSRTPAPPKAAKTWSSTSTTDRSRTLRATNGWVLTLHEFVIDGDDAWVTANKNMPMDLSQYGGAYNGALIDSAVQEYDLQDRQAAAATGTRSSTSRWASPMRIAADQRLPVGRLPRQLDPAGRATERSWCRCATPGPPTSSTSRTGQRSSGRSAASTRASRFGPDAAFQWQHDVRLQPGSTVTMFDDHCCQLTGGGTYVDADRPVARARAASSISGARTATLAAPATAAASGFDVGLHGRHRSRCPTATCSSAGARTVLLRVQRARASCCSKANFPGPTSATARRSSSGSGCR